MKVSLNWIKDYVKLPDDIDIDRLMYDLTMSTVEVEGITRLADMFNNMVIGVVDEIRPHPNADKLILCQTNLGNDEVREIVCGGTNLYKGIKVAVARPGSMVRWHGEGELVKLGVAKVRGVESYGMICSSSEIGLFDLFPFYDNENEATIMDLSDFDVPAGTSLADALGLDDIILEIDNKSLTNRPDLWGHYGIAREISALYSLPLNEIKPLVLTPKSNDFTVKIDDPIRCPRYIGVELDGLSVEPAPFIVQTRIWSVGMRPVNAIVDITNYVMLATGQPTHAFDADRIKGHITVRRAFDKEELLLLNGKQLSLSTENLVIADDEGAVALAGVMGGEKDSILPDTKRVILEIANFEAISTRRTAASFEVRTESATRYEKAIDPERCDVALSIAMKLFEDFYPSMTITGFYDNYPKSLERSKITVSLSWLTSRLGKVISNEKIIDLLSNLGFDIDFEGDNMYVVAPTWRSTGDISIPEDILEEIARMYGLENFEPTSIVTSFDNAINQLDVDVDRKIREYLAFRCGMREVFTYPWMNDEYVNATMLNKDELLSLSEPPSSNENYIRSSLIPNICKAVHDNLRFYDEFAIFESAVVFFNKDFTAIYDNRESLPLQRRNVVGAFTAGYDSVNSLFRKIKGVIEYMHKYTHISPLSFERSEKPMWADDVVWLNIYGEQQKVGDLALLSKKVTLDCGIKNNAVILFEIDIDLLKSFPSRTNIFENLPSYPMNEYDLSLLFDTSVKWDSIVEVINSKKGSGSLLRDVLFVDEYKGRQVPEGKKSISFRLIIGSSEKTLTSDEIEQCANAVVKRLSKTLGAQLRS